MAERLGLSQQTGKAALFAGKKCRQTQTIAIANGRIYVSAEVFGYPNKGWCHMYSVVMSAPEEADLLDANS